MKSKLTKYILIFISVLVISCEDNSKVEISTEEYNKLKDINKQFFTVNDESYEIFNGSDGHQYYGVLIATGNYSNTTHYFHYVDCKKCLVRDSLNCH